MPSDPNLTQAIKWFWPSLAVAMDNAAAWTVNNVFGMGLAVDTPNGAELIESGIEILTHPGIIGHEDKVVEYVGGVLDELFPPNERPAVGSQPSHSIIQNIRKMVGDMSSVARDRQRVSMERHEYDYCRRSGTNTTVAAIFTVVAPANYPEWVFRKDFRKQIEAWRKARRILNADIRRAIDSTGQSSAVLVDTLTRALGAG